MNGDYGSDNELEFEDQFQAITLEQMTVGRESNVLMFMRDPSKFAMPLARKLRPEFKKFFVTSEYNDCLKILNKVTNASLDQVGAGLHLIICDVDAVTLRLIDYVGKRPCVAETSNCPLIPVVIMRNAATADPEMLKQLSSSLAVDGAGTAWNKVVDTRTYTSFTAHLRSMAAGTMSARKAPERAPMSDIKTPKFGIANAATRVAMTSAILKSWRSKVMICKRSSSLSK